MNTNSVPWRIGECKFFELHLSFPNGVRIGVTEPGVPPERRGLHSANRSDPGTPFPSSPRRPAEPLPCDCLPTMPPRLIYRRPSGRKRFSSAVCDARAASAENFPAAPTPPPSPLFLWLPKNGRCPDLPRPTTHSPAAPGGGQVPALPKNKEQTLCAARTEIVQASGFYAFASSLSLSLAVARVHRKAARREPENHRLFRFLRCRDAP